MYTHNIYTTYCRAESFARQLYPYKAFGETKFGEWINSVIHLNSNDPVK